MSTESNYEYLLDQSRKGNLTAYNKLCTDFLEYVPWIVKDMEVFFKKCKIEMEDLHQEGYLAICEAITEMIKSDKQYTTKEISQTIVNRIAKAILDMIRSLRIHDENETPQVFKYNSFHKFMCAINDDNFKRHYIAILKIEL